MAVICDGVGGLSYGELASSSVAAAFAAWFENDLPQLLTLYDGDPLSSIRSSWATLLHDLDAAIRRYGEESGASLATTCTAMMVVGNGYLIAHVGDCRAYAFSDNGLRRLTEDQTLLAREIARGAITPEETAGHAEEHIILQAIGAPNGIEPIFSTGSVDAEAIYILATDGAYRKAGDGGIAAAFNGISRSDESLSRACNKLIRTSIGRGETDNLAVAAFSSSGGDE